MNVIKAEQFKDDNFFKQFEEKDEGVFYNHCLLFIQQNNPNSWTCGFLFNQNVNKPNKLYSQLLKLDIHSDSRKINDNIGNVFTDESYMKAMEKAIKHIAFILNISNKFTEKNLDGYYIRYIS